MKQKIKFFALISSVLVLLVSLFAALPAAAGTGNVGTPGAIQNPAPDYLVHIDNFGDLLAKAVLTLLTFAGAIAVVFLMIGGFQYVSSRGNEEAMEKAKKTVTSAIIGIVIIVMAYAIVSIVNTLLTTQPS
jgi:hypothetical protein